MEQLLRQKIAFSRQKLLHDQTRLRYLSPMNQLNEKRRRTLEYEEKLSAQMERQIKDKKHKLMLLAGTLDAYSPMKKLGNGYAYVEGPEGKALLHSDDVKTSDAIAVHLLDGTVKAVVSEVVKNE